MEVIDYLPKYYGKKISSKNIKRFAIDLITIRRRRRINRFYEENFIFTNICYKRFSEVRDNPPNADVYIVGSDQVWNSQIFGGELDPTFFFTVYKW